MILSQFDDTINLYFYTNSNIGECEEWIMAVSYKKLWKLLIDKDLKKKDLLEMAHISSYTLNKLNRCENVNVDVLVRICAALDCPIESIMEIIPDEK